MTKYLRKEDTDHLMTLGVQSAVLRTVWWQSGPRLWWHKSQAAYSKEQGHRQKSGGGARL